jgi:hypothetical protein
MRLVSKKWEVEREREAGPGKNSIHPRNTGIKRKGLIGNYFQSFSALVWQLFFSIARHLPAEISNLNPTLKSIQNLSLFGTCVSFV